MRKGVTSSTKGQETAWNEERGTQHARKLQDKTQQNKTTRNRPEAVSTSTAH